MTEEYSKLVQSVELKEMALVDLNHHRELNLHSPLDVKHTFRVALASFSDSQFTARADFSLDAVPKGTETQHDEELTPDVSIKLTYYLIYVVSPGEFKPTVELVREFVDRNVPVNVWPFIRETVAALTAKMGLPPLILRTLKIIR